MVVLTSLMPRYYAKCSDAPQIRSVSLRKALESSAKLDLADQRILTNRNAVPDACQLVEREPPCVNTLMARMISSCVQLARVDCTAVYKTCRQDGEAVLVFASRPRASICGLQP